MAAALAALLGAGLAGAAPARAAPGEEVAPGVRYEEFGIPASHGATRAHLLRVDLSRPGVRVGLLSPGKVSARAAVSAMADARGAVGGVNGDFFHLSEAQHPGVAATGASVGPVVADGRTVKGAVPDGQRFGPALPPGTSTRDVIGVGADGRARLDRLALDGHVRTRAGRLPLGGLNQYALPEGSVGAFTSAWGGASRARAVCGSDTDRAAPCSTETHEVTVRGGRVVSVAGTPGGGPVARGTTVLVGREAGARRLRALVSAGGRVTVRHRLVAAASREPYRFALGGVPVLAGGQPLPGLDTRTPAVRTAAGVADGGRRLLLFAVDGGPAYRSGLTVAEVAAVLRRLGADDAVNLDGGGSSTLVVREPGAAAVSVRNHPSGGVQRPVPNGIGVFTKP